MVGIRDAETKKKLLAISPFPGTHEVATICRCEETASENERTLSGQASVSAVKMRKDWAPSNRPQFRCKACGRTAHTRDNPCPAIGKTCHLCGKADHFSPCCPDRTISEHKEKSKIGRVFIGSVNANPRSAPTITLEVLNESGHRIKCIPNVVPDGGAEVTVVGMDAMKEMDLFREDLVKATFEIVQADKNTPLGNIGQQDIYVQYGNAKATIMVVFCPDVTGMLLSWINCIDLNILPKDYPKPINVGKMMASAATISGRPPSTAFNAVQNVMGPINQPTNQPTNPTNEQIENTKSILLKTYADVSTNPAPSSKCPDQIWTFS